MVWPPVIVGQLFVNYSVGMYIQWAFHEGLEVVASSETSLVGEVQIFSAMKNVSKNLSR